MEKHDDVRLLIRTSSHKSIESSKNMRWRGNIYGIWVVEEPLGGVKDGCRCTRAYDHNGNPTSEDLVDDVWVVRWF